jgi:hypothetical protein
MYCENVYDYKSGPPVEISIERIYTASQDLLKIDSKEIKKRYIPANITRT